MEAPLGITFFKKVELYQTIRDLNDKARIEDKNSGGTVSVWPIGRKILKWTREKHKHPQSSFSDYRLYYWDKDNKLNDIGISREDLYRGSISKDKQKNETQVTVEQIFKHLDFFGFAKFEDNSNKSEYKKNRDKRGRIKIYITKEGFLAGKVLAEQEKKLTWISYQVWGRLWGHLGASILLIIIFGFTFDFILKLYSEFSPVVTLLINIYETVIQR